MTPLDSHTKSYLTATIRKYFPTAEILFFGSRFRGDHKPMSDIDLCVDAGSPMSLGNLALLDEELSQSDLEFKVDLSDWHRISADFKKHIQASSETW